MVGCLGLSRMFIPLSLRLVEHFSSGDGKKIKRQKIRSGGCEMLSSGHGTAISAILQWQRLSPMDLHKTLPVISQLWIKKCLM